MVREMRNAFKEETERVFASASIGLGVCVCGSMYVGGCVCEHEWVDDKEKENLWVV